MIDLIVLSVIFALTEAYFIGYMTLGIHGQSLEQILKKKFVLESDLCQCIVRIPTDTV